jgi:iron complex transport system permease protein
VVTGGALAGGLVTAVAIYALAWRRGVTGYRLVLVGIGLTAALHSVTSYLLIRAQIDDAARATVWLTGSLNGRGWDHVVPVALALAVLVPLCLSQGRGLRALQLGDDAAQALGVPANTTRAVLILAAVLLAAVATASADLVAQHLMGGLPVGVATALVGAPYLLFLLSRANRIGADG